MNDTPVTMTEIESSRLDWIGQHRSQYISSNGAEGHIVDLTDIGGLSFTTCLLLRTTGRKTGKTRILPLIYGDTGGEVVIVASKGGADVHPAWYVNMQGGSDVAFQIGGQAFEATWREPTGAEHDEVWAFMEKLYPPYKDYKAATTRKIPLIMMKATKAIDTFKG
jgi:deazaflavin-dependent oxidoreductase (nitroreductase family)